MIDHCVSAFSQKKEEETYRSYVTDALKVIGNLNVRYWDMIHPVKEERSAEEIIDSISQKLRRLGNSEPI